MPRREKARLIVVSDTHVGSEFAVCPKRFKTKHGGEIGASYAQKKLRSYWEDFIVKVKPTDKDYLVLVGDLCEGPNHKEFGKNLTTANLTDQVEMALLLLKPFVEARCRIFGVVGSNYHGGEKMPLDEVVIKRLGGTCFGKMANLEIADTGKVIQIRHGAGGLPKSPAQKLEVEHSELIQAERDGFYERHIDVLIKGHLHVFRSLDVADRLLIQAPAWKGWFPYKDGWGKFIRRPGGCVIYLEKGRHPTAEKHLYPYVPVYDSLKKV